MAANAAWAWSSCSRNPEYARSQQSMDSRTSPSHHSASARLEEISGDSPARRARSRVVRASSQAPRARAFRPASSSAVGWGTSWVSMARLCLIGSSHALLPGYRHATPPARHGQGRWVPGSGGPPGASIPFSPSGAGSQASLNPATSPQPERPWNAPGRLVTRSPGASCRSHPPARRTRAGPPWPLRAGHRA